MNAMQLSPQGIEWLKTIECLACTPYDDQTGQPVSCWVPGATIGYGHLIAGSEWPRYSEGIDQAGAEALLCSDLAPFVATVNASIGVPLRQNRFDALVILAYNIGRDAFARSSVVKLVNDPAAHTAYPDLEQAWKAWNKSQGRVMQGLVNRRNAEWTMYSTGRYEYW